MSSCWCSLVGVSNVDCVGCVALDLPGGACEVCAVGVGDVAEACGPEVKSADVECAGVGCVVLFSDV